MSRFDPIPLDATPRQVAAALLRDATPGPRRSWGARDAAANQAALALHRGSDERARTYAAAHALLLDVERRALVVARASRAVRVDELLAHPVLVANRGTEAAS